MDRPSPSPILATDVPCIRCGYNLRTLGIESACPECGLAVEETLRVRATWQKTQPDRIRRGLWLLIWMQGIWMLIALVLGGPLLRWRPDVLILFVPQGFRPYSIVALWHVPLLAEPRIYLLLATPSWALGAVGTWLITVRLDPKGHRLASLMLRWCLVGNVIAGGVGIASLISNSSLVWTNNLISVMVLADLLLQLCSGLQFAAIAKHFRMSGAARRAIALGCLAAIAEGGLCVSLLFERLWTQVAVVQYGFVVGICATSALGVLWPALILRIIWGIPPTQPEASAQPPE